MSNGELSSAKREIRLAVRMQEAKDLTQQAMELVRGNELMTFDAALALLERLRKEEAQNDSVRQQCTERLSERMTPSE